MESIGYLSNRIALTGHMPLHSGPPGMSSSLLGMQDGDSHLVHLADLVVAEDSDSTLTEHWHDLLDVVTSSEWATGAACRLFGTEVVR